MSEINEKKSWYLKCKPADIAKQVILVGDPARVTLFAEQMTAAEIVAEEREFTTLTGQYQETNISVVSVGIGAPSTAIVLEELWELGVQVVIRAGTALALNVPVGHFILASGAIRYDGVSTTYLPLEFPAVSDPDLLFSFRHTLKEEQVACKTGLMATSDGFYTHLFKHTVPGHDPQRRPDDLLGRFTEWGVLGADMETSAVYTIGHYLGLKTLAVLVATVDGKTRKMLEAGLRQKKELQLAQIVLQGLSNYVTHDVKGKQP